MDGWMVYERSVAGEVSGEKCLYSVTNVLWRSAPVMRQLINHPVDTCVQ